MWPGCFLWQVVIAQIVMPTNHQIQGVAVSNVPLTIRRFRVAFADHVHRTGHRKRAVRVYRVKEGEFRFREVLVYVQLGNSRILLVSVSHVMLASPRITVEHAEIVLAENRQFKVVVVPHAQLLRPQSQEVLVVVPQGKHLTRMVSVGLRFVTMSFLFIALDTHVTLYTTDTARPILYTMDTATRSISYASVSTTSTSSYSTDSSPSPITVSAHVGDNSAGPNTVIIASVLGVIFVVILSLSWYGYRRYLAAKNPSSSNSTKKSGYRNVSKLSTSLSSSFTNIVGTNSSREAGLSGKQDKVARGGAPLGLNYNSSSNLNNYGSSSNFAPQGNKMTSKIETLNNGQQNAVVSEYPNMELFKAAQKGTQKIFVNSINTSQAAQLFANGSMASPSDINTSPSPLLARTGSNGSQRNLINRRSNSPEARLARADSNRQRNPQDGNSPISGGFEKSRAKVPENVSAPNTTDSSAFAQSFQKKIDNSINLSDAAQLFAKGSPASPSNIIMSPSPVLARNGSNGSQRNLIDSRSNSPEARLARADSNRQRNPKDGNSPISGGFENRNAGGLTSYSQNQDNARGEGRINPPASSSDLLQSAGVRINEMTKSSSKAKVSENGSSPNTTDSSAFTESLGLYAYRQNSSRPPQL